MVQCNGPVNGRRKIFWTTQPNACGVDESCVGECGTPGLVLYIPEGVTNKGRTIRNDNYVLGLAINMLLTDGRKDDTLCGHRPGARGGHWTDGYREDGLAAGTQIRYIAPQKSVSDTVKLIKIYTEATLAKLVRYGVASAVNVTVKYLGRGVIAQDIEIIGTNGITSRVGLTGSRLENSWVWETTK